MIPKIVLERMERSVKKYRKVLQNAKDRDINETDTVSIVKDIFKDVFGYDKYVDTTSEYAIRTSYCDLAIKLGDKVEFLIEIKAVGLDLKDNYLRQVIDYGANEGIPWVILTNGILWELYKIKLDKMIKFDLIAKLNFLENDFKDAEFQEKLFLVCKEGIKRDAREEYHQKMLSVNRYILGALILNEGTLATIRRELRKISKGISIEADDIKKVLTNEVLKREAIEGEEAQKAQSHLRRFYNKSKKK